MISNNQLSNILDAVSPSASLRKIAKTAGSSASTVFNVLKDFPLWAFLKDKDKEDA